MVQCHSQGTQAINYDDTTLESHLNWVITPIKQYLRHHEDN